MEFADSDRVRALKARVAAFVETEVIPAEARYQPEERETGPWDTPGVTIERSTSVFGYSDSGHGGHAVIRYDDAWVPRENLHPASGSRTDV